MAVPGIFASHQGIVGNRVGDFASAILRVNPTGTAPLLALTSGMPKEAAKDVVTHWFEETHISGRATVTTGGAANATSIVVDDGTLTIS